MFPLSVFLFATTANATDLSGDVAHAKQAITEEKWDEAAQILENSQAHLKDANQIQDASEIASIFYYLAVVDHLNGDEKDDSLAQWRQSLIVDPELQWDSSLPDDDAESLFEALRTEVGQRSEVDLFLPTDPGASIFYVDGRVANIDIPPKRGTHLIQAQCADGSVHSKWTDFQKNPKWRKMCPKGGAPPIADTKPVEEDEFADARPDFGSGVPAAMVTPVVEVTPEVQKPSGPSRAGTELLDVELRAAYQRVLDMDAAGFNRYVTDALTRVEADTLAMTPRLAAQLHLVVGLRHHLKNDDQKALAAFRSAILADPNTSFPDNVVTVLDTIAPIFALAKEPSEDPKTELQAPPNATVEINGHPNENHPTDRPFHLQLRDANGKVYWSRYIEAGATVAKMPPPQSSTSVLEAQARPAASRKETTLLMPMIAGSAGIVSATSYVISHTLRNRYDAPNSPDVTTRSDLENLRRSVNSTAIISASSGVAAIAVGTAIVVTMVW